MVKIGLIGVGRWGKNLLRVFGELADLRACAVLKSKPPRGMARDSRVLWTRRYRDILESPAIDAVAIATPLATHYRISREALEAGKHVFVEKPMCRTPEEAEDLVVLQRKTKKILMVGHIFLHHPVYSALGRILRKDPILSLHTEWNKLGTFEENIIDSLVSHDVALSLGFFGMSPHRARIRRQGGFARRVDWVEAELEFSGGRRHFIRINRLYPSPMRTARLVTESGRLYHWQGDWLLRWNTKAGRFQKVFSASREPLDLECRAFLSAVRGGKSPSTDAAFGARVVEVLAALRKKKR